MTQKMFHLVFEFTFLGLGIPLTYTKVKYKQIHQSQWS